MKTIKNIPVEAIMFDKLPINPTVMNLVYFILSGGVVPPVKLQKSSKGGYKLRDGRHRLCAYKLLGYKQIEASFSN